MQTQILVPAAVLIIWSLVMLLWMGAARFPAMARAGIRLQERTGGRGQDLEGVLEPSVNWKAHNYAHLMEQPTLFYACVLILALVGYSPLVLVAAWLYVTLRIAHSLWQALVNTIPVRFTLFMLSSFVLLFMAVNALVEAL
ncbi:MAPEG family protein [Aurantiacibacter suaedae]|uniref:MAPEG family protein n=1 Tax=Aurantiacibacter suaedae TaxID=2545755 RepID=UPI0010F50201|nr:MAPEG family protein [Aurantiacibacter suaedae]